MKTYQWYEGELSVYEDDGPSRRLPLVIDPDDIMNTAVLTMLLDHLAGEQDCEIKARTLESAVSRDIRKYNLVVWFMTETELNDRIAKALVDAKRL
ncbi:MAG: hypothetical protein ACLQJF_11770 [Candidatus Sulfotelmatobacter sp.]|jgi:hypothetical protein